MITILCKLFIKEEKLEKSELRRRYGMLSSLLGIMLNVLLFAGKYLAGVLSGSIAIMADAFNNLSDAGSSIITLIGFKFAGKKPDPEHPFGHGRIEYLSGLAVAAMILVMGMELVKSSVGKIITPQPLETSNLVMVILAVSILVKFYMAYYNRAMGRRIDSPALKATAADSMNDTLSTFVVLVGIAIMRIADVNVDGWFGLVVAALVLWTGIGTVRDTLKPLLGQAPKPEFVAEIEHIIGRHEDIIGIHDLVVHDYGPGRVMISLHAEVPGNGNMYELHDSIDCAEKELKLELGCEATIHMDPLMVDDKKTNEYRARIKEILHEINKEFSIHDFRLVEGPTHVNLIFDLLVPITCNLEDKELIRDLEDRVKAWNPSCFLVIQIDRSYL